MTFLTFALLVGSADADDRAIKERKNVANSIGMELKLIKAGTFLMGSPAKKRNVDGNERPQHRVRISHNFYFGVTEVTQGQWQAVMRTTPWKGKQSVKEGANYPATYISWNEAVEFCRRLSANESQTYRLPTEAEWEYACRAGTTTKFSYGDDVDKLGDYSWFLSIQFGLSGFRRPFPRDGTTAKEQYAHEVGKKRPNPWGLFDMHANVTEWCQDWYGEYKSPAAVDPTGPVQGSFRVIRGGGWNSNSETLISWARFPGPTKPRHSSIGFRVVRVLASPVKKPAVNRR